MIFYINAQLYNILLSVITFTDHFFSYLITEGLGRTDGRSEKHGSFNNIIYHDFLPPPRRAGQFKSDNTHNHTTYTSLQ